MSKFKMICLDIDGTLLNSKHEITENTRRTIQEAANEKRIPVILVSARMPKGMLFLQDELHIVQPIICFSGALIWNDNNILQSITIPAADVMEIYRLAKSINIHMSLYKENEWYVENMDSWVLQEGQITKLTPKITDFFSLFSTWAQENSGPNKILCMAEPDRIKLLDAKMKEHRVNHVNAYFSKPTYLEIMPSNATKTSAIEILCRKFDVQKSEIIAIGDNFNDVNMIEYAGLGIAMGNAPDQVKQYADAVTASNDEDGVAEAIKKYVL